MLFLPAIIYDSLHKASILGPPILTGLRHTIFLSKFSSFKSGALTWRVSTLWVREF